MKVFFITWVKVWWLWENSCSSHSERHIPLMVGRESSSPTSVSLSLSFPRSFPLTTNSPVFFWGGLWTTPSYPATIRPITSLPCVGRSLRCTRPWPVPLRLNTGRPAKRMLSQDDDCLILGRPDDSSSTLKHGS